MEAVKKLWKFPVPSTRLADGGVKLICPGGDAWLLFDYYIGDKIVEVFNSGIIFKAVQAHRHVFEKFTQSFEAYDCLVEITNSKWVAQLRRINKRIADFWDIKHYAIYLDSNGLYEFIARSYSLMEIKKGSIYGLFDVK